MGMSKKAEVCGCDGKIYGSPIAACGNAVSVAPNFRRCRRSEEGADGEWDGAEDRNGTKKARTTARTWTMARMRMTARTRIMSPMRVMTKMMRMRVDKALSMRSR